MSSWAGSATTYAQQNPLFTLSGAVAVYLFIKLLVLYDLVPLSLRSKIAKIPGPGLGRPITGHVLDLFLGDGTEVPSAKFLDWHRRFGDVFLLRGIAGERLIMVHDPVALQYLNTHQELFEKPKDIARRVRFLVGNGLLVVEGDEHRQQRRIIAPAFSAPAISTMSPAFTEKALIMAEQWERQILAGAEKEVEIETYDWLSRVTLDALGRGAFGVDFNTLDSTSRAHAPVEGSALEKQFNTVCKQLAFDIANNQVGGWPLIHMFLVLQLPFRLIVALNGAGSIFKKEMKVRNELERAARQLIDERRETHVESDLDSKYGKNLLDLLLRSNAATEAKHRLSDEAMIAQLMTFIVAGHETSSTALGWILHLLSRHQDVQVALRTEIRAAKKAAREDGTALPNGELPYDILDKLPLLDGVIREAMRIRPPVNASSKTALADASVPLARPITLSDGTTISTLDVKKGQELFTSNYIPNLREDVWGADTHAFNPYRWIEDSDVGKKGGLKQASVYAQIMTFLGGHRACIGYRFAIAEIKAILAAGVLDRFHLNPKPGVSIEASVNIVVRPRVLSEPEKSTQVPLLVSLAE